MNGNKILAASIGIGHQLTLAVVSDCTPETLAKKVGNIETAGSVLAHAIITEDFFIQKKLQDKELLYQTGGFAPKIGISLGDAGPQLSEAFAQSVKMDMATFMPYLQAVFAATDAYVAGLSEADLDREIDGPFGKQGVGEFIAGLVAFHLSEHLGEIAAIKGVQGLKGLPF